MKISHYNITELKSNEVFVFGSNEGGFHSKGAAKQAKRWGAKNGIGWGLQGQTYGIPTKNKKIQTLGLSKIREYIFAFIEFAKLRPDLEFLVTEIGCGLAGYEPKNIAPFFFESELPNNISLPKSFWKFKK